MTWGLISFMWINMFSLMSLFFHIKILPTLVFLTKRWLAIPSLSNNPSIISSHCVFPYPTTSLSKPLRVLSEDLPSPHMSSSFVLFSNKPEHESLFFSSLSSSSTDNVLIIVPLSPSNYLSLSIDLSTHSFVLLTQPSIYIIFDHFNTHTMTTRSKALSFIFSLFMVFQCYQSQKIIKKHLKSHNENMLCDLSLKHSLRMPHGC